MKTITIIPARGGSKGIKNKNIIKLAGRPLIGWTIEQARNSLLIKEVFVSTDDNKIADISRDFGAEVIMRPAVLSTDISSSEEALLHALDVIESMDKRKIDIVVFLQATSPIREKNDIDNAISKFLSEQADSLFSCVRLEDYFIWGKKDESYVSVNYDFQNRKIRQHIVPQYLENGSIYIFKPELLRKEKNRLGGKIAIYEMAFWKSYQVDELDDLEICEYYIKNKLLKKGNRCKG